MELLDHSLRSLENYIEKEKYRGYDCYDALNSPLLSFLSFNDKRLRIAYIQALKILPVNLRPLLLISKGHNPKGLGLILSATSNLWKTTGDKNYLKKLEFLTTLLTQCSSKGYSGNCWGYNFDWQSRVFFVPKYTPTIVNTSYVGHAFLDAFTATKNEEYLRIARSACDFILKDLNRATEGDTLCFSYTPIDRLQVHNANILGGGFLARVFSYTGEEELRDTAKRSVAYVMRHQNSDGSWYYAETNIQKWIDSFHTGFVLESLKHYTDSTGDKIFEINLKTGFDFFVNHFFLEDGTPKYFHDRVFPLDIHSAAQGLVTLTKLKSLDPAATAKRDKLAQWVIHSMQDTKGFFYFQKRKYFTNKIPYMRWSQAWMYHALALCLGDQKNNQGDA
jgi:rhamnogalacturonyl hydrolase YesR